MDESSAQVILLVAPAGYGKTTLARQWIASKPHAWYECGPGSSDIAAAAVGIAKAAESFIPGFEARISNLVRAFPGRGDSPDLVNALSQAFTDKWPADRWLVIDDHHLIDGLSAGTFVHALANSAEIRLLVCSRSEPSWVTSRELLYGDALEIDQTELSMSEAEARQALASQSPQLVASLVPLADGWPAVIGLAAFTRGISTQPSRLMRSTTTSLRTSMEL